MYYGRGPNKVKNPYTFKHMYKEYIKDKREGTPYYIPYSTYVKLCSIFYKRLADYLLEGGWYKLPYRMGELQVVKKKPKVMDFRTMSLDWKATTELGKQVFHINDHTSYYKYRLHWRKIEAFFSNKGKYRLVMTRRNKRRLAQLIKSGEYEYFELD